MHFREVQPVRTPFVECFWSFSTAREFVSGPGLVTPDGCIELVFALEGGEISLPSRRGHQTTVTPARSTAFVLGITSKPCCFEFGPSTRLLGARLSPAAALRLFGDNLALLRDSACPAFDLAPTLIRRISDRLSRSMLDRPLVVFERELAQAMEPSKAPDERVARAAAIISAREGSTCLVDVAREVGMSSRHLDRCFHKHLGLCPKLYSRIVRFRTAWKLGLEHGRPAWAAIAARCGYADQAHLCREFREFAGMTPVQSIAFA